MGYPNAIFSVFSFIGFLLCAIPFTWHLKNWNTGTCLFMAWSGLFCLNQSVNSVIWNGNVVNWSPVWCDISTRIYIGSSVGLPAASLCIFRRLYSISTARTLPTADKSVKHRRVMIDLAIGLGLPLLEIIFGYIVQGHRFNILEDFGCYIAIYPCWVSIALMGFPPVLIGSVTACYAVLSFRAFNRRRIEFNDLLAPYSNLTSSFYLRLMGFASLEVLCTIPLGTYFIVANIKGGIEPWISWDNTHSHFSRVRFLPSSFWQESEPHFRLTVELGRWIGVIGAFIFFAFFGFAEEARTNYRAAYLTVAKHIGFSTGFSKPSADPQPTPRPMSKRNNIDALVFVHTANTTISIPIPDIEDNISDEKGDTDVSAKIFQDNTTFDNDSSDAEARNEPISPTFPEPASTNSYTLPIV